MENKYINYIYDHLRKNVAATFGATVLAYTLNNPIIPYNIEGNPSMEAFVLHLNCVKTSITHLQHYWADFPISYDDGEISETFPFHYVETASKYMDRIISEAMVKVLLNKKTELEESDELEKLISDTSVQYQKTIKLTDKLNKLSSIITKGTEETMVVLSNPETNFSTLINSTAALNYKPNAKQRKFF